MNIPIKYGLLITLVVVVWIITTRFLFPLEQNSGLNLLAPVIFNVAALLSIYFGLQQKRRETEGSLSFKESTKTGVSIAFVYALSSSLFFVILLWLMGPELLASEPMAQTRPMWQVIVMAFAGLFFGSLIFGLIYSVVISFLVVRTRAR